jgi:phosphoserine phosphatase RsbU/P
VAHPTKTSQSDSDIISLLEFSTVVNSSLDLRFILGTVLLTLMGKLLITKGIVLLRKQGKTFHLENGKGIPKEFLHTDIELPRVAKKSFNSHISGEDSFGKLCGTGINKFFPIISQGNVMGYFGLAESTTKPILRWQQQFVDTLINISAAAIEKGIAFDELKSVNRTLDGKIQQLKTLFELGKEFNGILQRENLLKLFSLTLMGQVGTNRYAICLKEGSSIYSRIDGSSMEKDKKKIFDLISVPITSENVPATKKYAGIKNYLTAQKIAAMIPLELQSEVKGVLCIGERMRGGAYTQSDLEFIYSLANLAFVSLENSRLFAEAIEKQKLENELLIAKEIQQRLLPGVLPSIEGFEVSAINVSSKQVGGDYYDVVPASENKYVFVIADVSGKGTPASLLMSNVQAAVQAFVPMNLPLGEMTGKINNLIYKNTGADKFITFFWGMLDPERKTFRYVNAGHNQPFLLRSNGTVERLTEGGLILGIMQTIAPYSEGEVELHPGDSIILFTDGVSEAMDINDVDYTEERLQEFITPLKNLSAKEMREQIVSEIRRHTADAVQSDDITLLVLRMR